MGLNNLALQILSLQSYSFKTLQLTQRIWFTITNLSLLFLYFCIFTQIGHIVSTLSQVKRTSAHRPMGQSHLLARQSFVLLHFGAVYYFALYLYCAPLLVFIHAPIHLAMHTKQIVKFSSVEVYFLRLKFFNLLTNKKYSQNASRFIF